MSRGEEREGWERLWREEAGESLEERDD